MLLTKRVLCGNPVHPVYHTDNSPSYPDHQCPWIDRYVYNNHPNALNKAIHRYQKQLGIPPFKFHALRSYFASYAHSLGIPDADIMSIGGWETDAIMKKVYRKSMEESKKHSMDIITKHLFWCHDKFMTKFSEKMPCNVQKLLALKPHKTNKKAP